MSIIDDIAADIQYNETRFTEAEARINSAIQQLTLLSDDPVYQKQRELLKYQINENMAIIDEVNLDNQELKRRLEDAKRKEAVKVTAKANTATDQVKNINSVPVKSGSSKSDQSTATAKTQNPATQNTGTDTSGLSSTPLPATNKARLTGTAGTGLAIGSTGLIGSSPFPIPGVTDTSPVANDDDNPSSNIIGSDPVFSGGSTTAPIQYEVQPNPLHEYINYTYGLTLHVLSKEDYITLTNDPTSFKPTRTMVSSASRYKNTRMEDFKDDFYFEDLKMSSIIGLNNTTRGSNAIQVKFNLIEPYGMTLIDRILDISSNEFNVGNYLELPYLLEINFFGYTSDGQPAKLEEHTKFIPVRIIEMNIRASTKGTEYAITAIPFNQVGNLQTMQAIKANFEISGRTVRDIFKNDLDSTELQTTIRAESERQREQATSTVRTPTQPTSNNGAATTGAATMNSATQPTVKVASFTGAYNLFNLYEQEHGNVEFADQIIFKIHEEIANSKVTEPEKTSAKNTPAVNPNATGTQTSSVTPSNPDTQVPDKNKAGPDFTKSIFNVNAGTSIIDFLNTIIINSEYITGQLEDFEKNRSQIKTADDMLKAAGEGASHVNWFKIVPKVELLDFDKKRNKWAKRITFYVLPYRHYNARDGRAALSGPPGAVKEYNFIYSGKNLDIIDFSLNFDTLYYTAIQVSRSRMESTSIAQKADPRSVTKSNVVEPLPNSIMPSVNDITLGSHSSTLGTASTDSSKMNAMSFRDSIYSNAAGDMLQIKLKIVGDPEFIKQDEIFYNPETAIPDGSQYVPGTRSLATDDGEIYCIVNFKTPVDIDETTGMLREDGKFSVSGFSGYYRITEVETELYKGQFVQTLTMYRHPNQEAKTDSADSRPSAPNKAGI